MELGVLGGALSNRLVYKALCCAVVNIIYTALYNYLPYCACMNTAIQLYGAGTLIGYRAVPRLARVDKREESNLTPVYLPVKALFIVQSTPAYVYYTDKVLS